MKIRKIINELSDSTKVKKALNKKITAEPEPGTELESFWKAEKKKHKAYNQAMRLPPLNGRSTGEKFK